MKQFAVIFAFCAMAFFSTQDVMAQRGHYGGRHYGGSNWGVAIGNGYGGGIAFGRGGFGYGWGAPAFGVPVAPVYPVARPVYGGFGYAPYRGGFGYNNFRGCGRGGGGVFIGW